MSDAEPDVAVIGGGICGLATALALEQRGWSPTVYEAATEYRPVGAGLLLQTNALLVLDRLGVADRVRAAGVPLDETVIRSPSGRALQRLDLDGVERPEFGYGFVAIHRAALQRALLDELTTEVRTDMTCEAVPATDPPRVRFADGTVIEPDVVVGADGIESTVREAVAPGVELQAMDSLVYRAVTEVGLPDHHWRRGLEVWGDGSYTGGAPLSETGFYWFATMPEPPAAESPPAGRTKSALRERFADFPEPVPAVVESLDPEDVFVTELADVPPLDRWHRGSVVLAGDAAHGMLPFAGQGAAQSIEDALVLAHVLDNYREPQQAFDGFVARRKDRADRIRTESRRLGALGTTQSTVAARLRNLAAAAVPGPLFRRFRRRRVGGTTPPPVVGSSAGHI